MVALALGYCVYMHSVLVSPLQQMLKWANRMAAGDLTQKITVSRDDTVGHLQKALSQLNVNLLSIVRDARLEAEHMQVSTQEIAQGNQDLSARTESQASNLEQTAALDGRNHRHGAPDCRVCPPGYFAGHAGHYGG